MKRFNQKWLKSDGPLTIWSPGAKELIPDRFRRILTVVLPIFYVGYIMFGINSAIIPIPTFALLVGDLYGSVWATLVAILAGISLFGLIFRLRFEIYSAIFLAAVLLIYAFYVAIIAYTIDDSRSGVIWVVALYPVLPVWRAVDISIEIRKSRKRQLYAEKVSGEP